MSQQPRPERSEQERGRLQQEIRQQERAQRRHHAQTLAEFAQRNGLRDLEKKDVCACWIRGDRPHVNHVDMIPGSCPSPTGTRLDGSALLDHMQVFARALSKPGGRIILGFPYPGSLAGYGARPSDQYQADTMERALAIAGRATEDLATKNGLNWAVRGADHPYASYYPGHAQLVLVCSPDLDPAVLLNETTP